MKTFVIYCEAGANIGEVYNTVKRYGGEWVQVVNVGDGKQVVVNADPYAMADICNDIF